MHRSATAVRKAASFFFFLECGKKRRSEFKTVKQAKKKKETQEVQPEQKTIKRKIAKKKG